MEGPPAAVGQTPRPRWRRSVLVIGVVLAVAGLVGVAFGSFRLASAAALRDRAAEITDRSESVREEQSSVEARFRERTREADRLRDAENAVVDGVIDILRFSQVVLGRYNAMVGAFNRAVDAYNAGDPSSNRTIIEEEAGPAIEDVADAVRDQQRTLAAVRKALRTLEEALEE